ncbi:MAG: dephospho-CoA kinase [Acidimicrobiales bacterium]
MLLVGLTGGIGSGKSTVAAMLAARGAVIIDADAIARRLQAPGTEVFRQMVERFGPEVVAPDGTLDRRALAAVAFTDPGLRRDLEAIVHPAVAAVVVEQLQAEAGTDHIVVYDVALLVETRAGEYGAVVVVDVDPVVALDRLVVQRGMDEADARNRMANQVGRDERRAVADRIIDNSGPLVELQAQVDALWDWLRSLPQA